MNTLQGPVVTVIAVVAPLLGLAITIVFTRVMVRWGMAEYARAFPPCEPDSDGVSKSAQSFSFGMMNFGGCVNVTVDSRCLHLRPGLLGRFILFPPMSIPWEAITLKRVPRWGNWLSAALAVGASRRTMHGPRWCLELAAPPA